MSVDWHSYQFGRLVLADVISGMLSYLLARKGCAVAHLDEAKRYWGGSGITTLRTFCDLAGSPSLSASWGRFWLRDSRPRIRADLVGADRLSGRGVGGFV